MGDLVEVQVMLNLGESGQATAFVVVPVLLGEVAEGRTLDDQREEAECIAVDALRPFLNNRTHAATSVGLPTALDEMASASTSEGDDRG